MGTAEKVYKALPGEHNLRDYAKVCNEFKFLSVEKEFSWHKTGKVNIAYEAVDRHVDEENMGESIALYFSDGKRDLSYTFLAAHAAPRETEVVAAIPLTRDGKVDRRVLKEWVLGLKKEVL